MSPFGTDLIYYKPWLFFIIIQTIGLTIFIMGMADNLNFYYRGKARSFRNNPSLGAMIKVFFNEVLLQRQLFARGFFRWLNHILIFWGFLGLLSLSAIGVLLKIVPGDSAFFEFFTVGSGYLYYKFVGDLAGLMVLAGAAAALIGRFTTGPDSIDTRLTDTAALGFLLLLVLTGFLLEALRLAATPWAPAFEYSFVAEFMAGLVAGRQIPGSLMTALWTFHATLTAAFVAYLPFSKLVHVFAAPAEIVINASEEELRGDLYGYLR